MVHAWELGPPSSCNHKSEREWRQEGWKEKTHGPDIELRCSSVVYRYQPRHYWTTHLSGLQVERIHVCDNVQSLYKRLRDPPKSSYGYIGIMLHTVTWGHVLRDQMLFSKFSKHHEQTRTQRMQSDISSLSRRWQLESTPSPPFQPGPCLPANVFKLGANVQPTRKPSAISCQAHQVQYLFSVSVHVLVSRIEQEDDRSAW